uniref:Uncharacterized protein n=1 Tax=Lepeophtheirus salmonis TaxID=72036 RepID=A0A0K2THE2_LEPSM
MVVNYYYNHALHLYTQYVVIMILNCYEDPI